MFEKEAEEYGHQHCCDSCKNLQARYKKVFKDGAEFGYNKAYVEADKNLKAVVADFNKANEWHKQEVDDIYDLIAEDWSIRYFICVMKDRNHVTVIGSCDEGCSGEVSVNLFFEHDDEKYHIDDIVWWKEIVLPELPKEIK